MRPTFLKNSFVRLAVMLTIVLATTAALGQTTSFTYQGRLTNGGTPANGTYDLQFKLFDSGTVGSGTQFGSTITNGTVTVACESGNKLPHSI